jgi:hypothetical protein
MVGSLLSKYMKDEAGIRKHPYLTEDRINKYFG